MSRTRLTFKNSSETNLQAAATHCGKTAEAIVRTRELLPNGDPRRARLHAIAEQMTSWVAYYTNKATITLEDAKAFRRFMAEQRRKVTSIRAEVLAKRSGICVAHESTDLDSEARLHIRGITSFGGEPRAGATAPR